MKNFLSDLPSPDKLHQSPKEPGYYIFEANGHIHTPYSFSAFSDLDSLFEKAKSEKIDLLGINDFYVTDGFEPFHDGCIASRIFPLFNIEFIGLMKDEQANGIRINDPNNPGRIYFCGKGLDYPFHLIRKNLTTLNKVKLETQTQLRAMVSRLNDLIVRIKPSLSLDFGTIKNRFAHELVRERHIARAVRYLVEENFNTPDEKLSFLESLYNGKKSRCGFTDPAALENEIRSNLLKAGGEAFVEEDENSFLPVSKIIEIITDAGGIPCYPVLLDDPTGNFTEFERDKEKLYKSLYDLNVGCIELIPGRNALAILENFVEFFNSRDFVITFGTEHNTPEMVPLAVSARGYMPLSEKSKQINRRGVSVIAAHQYFRAKGAEGYIDKSGKPRKNDKKEFEFAGQSVIKIYLTGK